MLAVSLTLLLLPLGSAQVGSIGTCSSESVNSYILALPNGVQCASAFQTVRFQTTSNQSAVESALDDFCTADCAEPLARYSALACGEVEFGVSLALYCLPAPESTVTQRCRTIFPDLVNGSIIPSIAEACANFTTECPGQECTTALLVGVEVFGCCYQTVYNSSEVVSGFTTTLSDLDMQVIATISEQAL